MAQPLQLEQITDISLISSSSAYTDVDTISFYVGGVYYGKYVASADAFVPDGTTPGAIGDVSIEIDNSVAGDFTIGDTLSITYDGITKTLILESVDNYTFYLDTNLVFFYNVLLTSFACLGIIIEESMPLTEDAGAEEIEIILERIYSYDSYEVPVAVIEDSIRFEDTIGIEKENSYTDTLYMEDEVELGLAGDITSTVDTDGIEIIGGILGIDIEDSVAIKEDYASEEEHVYTELITLDEEVATNNVAEIDEIISISDLAFLDAGEPYYELTTGPFNLGHPGLKLLSEVQFYGMLPETANLNIKLYYKNYGSTEFSVTDFRSINKTQSSVFYITGTEFKVCLQSDEAFNPETIRIKWKNIDKRYRRDKYVGSANTESSR